MKSGAFVHFSGFLLSTLGLLVGVRLITGAVGPDQYGVVGVYLGLATAGTYVARETICNLILRFAGDDAQDSKPFFSLLNHRIEKYSSIILLLLLCIYLSSDESLIRRSSLAGAIFILFAICTVAESYLSAARLRLEYAIHVCLLEWLRFFLAYGLCVLNSPDAENVMLGFIFAASVVLIYDRIVISRIGFRPEKKSIKINHYDMFGPKWSNRQLLLSGLIAWLIFVYDRCAITFFVGWEDAGLYIILFQIGYTPSFLICRSMVQYLLPIYAVQEAAMNRHKKKHIKGTRRAIAGIIATGLGVFCFVYIWHAEIFSILVGSSYSSASSYLPFVILSGFINSAAQFFQMNFIRAKDTSIILKSRIITAVICIALSSALIFKFGISGAIMMLCIFPFISLLILHSLSRKYI